MGTARKGGAISSFVICISHLLFASCANDDVPQPTANQPVSVDFALTVTKAASPGISGITRMASEYTVGTKSNIALQCAIPFTVNNVPVGVSDVCTSTPIGYFDQPRPTYPFFTSSCEFSQGTNAILAYASSNTNASLWQKGVLDATFNDYQPANISFRLRTIQSASDYLGTEQVKTLPEQLADYLTDIANTSIIGTDESIKTWKAYADPTNSTSMNNDLKLLFKNFTNQLSDEVGEVLPGSSANVKAWVIELWKQVNSLTSLVGDDASIRDAIKANIEEKLAVNVSPYDWKSDTKTAWDNFPASLYLPDGAAVVRWDGEKFVPETQTTTIADINNLERFTYPAEIYYYGNSATWVSDTNLSNNFKEKETWKKTSETDENYVLSGFEQGPVTSSTKTVAMFDPLEYGVGQLKVQLMPTSENLKDSKDINRSVGTENFKLTGIIVGGQLPVGFDFRPETVYPVYSEADMRFIYDSQVKTNGTTDTPFYLSTSANENYIQTLVLQSYTGRSLKLVLEFENNSDQDFYGYNGTVYRGTKFYLVGEVVPTNVENNPKVCDNRVFTQDYITTVNVTVTSMAKAYNVLPNLMSPRLEMGLELTPKWVQAETTDVIL